MNCEFKLTPTAKTQTGCILCAAIFVSASFKVYSAAALFVFALLAVILLNPIALWAKTRLSRSWPLIEVSVEDAHVQSFAGRRKTYVMELVYAYSFEGLKYFGSYQRSFDNEHDANQLLANLKDFPLRVRVDPRDPSRSFFSLYKDF